MKSTFEYNAIPTNVKIEKGDTFKCGDRKDGYNGFCLAGNYCNQLNVCKPIPHNPKIPITNNIPSSFERNFAYRLCRNNTDTQCIRSKCNDTCERSTYVIR
jgi:hypothetical protein